MNIMKKISNRIFLLSLLVIVVAGCQKEIPQKNNSLQNVISKVSDKSDYYSDGKMLIFKDSEIYSKLVSHELDNNLRLAFEKTILEMEHLTYFEKIKKDAVQDLIEDDFLSKILNEDRIVQIGAFIYKISLIDSSVFVLPAENIEEYGDLVNENIENENIRVYSTFENVIELAESGVESQKKSLFCSDKYAKARYESSCGNSIYIGSLTSLVFDCRIRYAAAGIFFNLKAWANTFEHGLGSTLESDQLVYYSNTNVNTTLRIDAERKYKERCSAETSWYWWSTSGNGAGNGITAQSYQGSKGLNKYWLKVNFYFWNGTNWVRIPPAGDWYPGYHRGITNGY